MKQARRMLSFGLYLAVVGLLALLLASPAAAQETTSEVLWDGTVAPEVAQGSHEVIVVPRATAICGQPFTFTYTTFEHPQSSVHRTTIHPTDDFVLPGSGM